MQRWAMSLRLLLVALVGAAVVAACASDDEALTVAEYAAQCGARSSNDQVWATWGDFAAELSDVYDELSAATPPSELVAFHAASTEATRVLLAFGEAQPADAPFDAAQLAAPELLATADALDAARALLPEDIRNELRVTGCIGDEAPIAAARDEALTVAEYAERCGARAGLDGTWATWGDFTAAFREVYDEMSVATPPNELVEFHAASIEVARVLVAFGEEQPADRLFDAVALNPPALSVVVGVLEAAQALLPDDIHNILRGAGCIGDDG